MLAQLQRFGAPPDVLAAFQAQHDAQQPQTVAVWPEHWHAVSVFIAMATQWHWAAGGFAPARRTGLRLEALPAVLPAVRADLPSRCRQPYPRLLRQLQQLEDQALTEWRLQAAEGR